MGQPVRELRIQGLIDLAPADRTVLSHQREDQILVVPLVETAFANVAAVGMINDA